MIQHQQHEGRHSTSVSSLVTPETSSKPQPLFSTRVDTNKTPTHPPCHSPYTHLVAHLDALVGGQRLALGAHASEERAGQVALPKAGQHHGHQLARVLRARSNLGGGVGGGRAPLIGYPINIPGKHATWGCTFKAHINHTQTNTP
jgi:hypothetical protein